MTDEKAGVIDSVAWMRRSAEELMGEDDPRAIELLERLLHAAEDDDTRFFCQIHLGLCHFRAGDLVASMKAFGAAERLFPEHPAVAYARSQCAAQERRWWQSLHHGLRAVALGRSHDDLPEFMRATAVAFSRLNMPEIALTILLGAVDRAPDDRYVLESLGRIYEDLERWVDAIAIRDALIDVLKTQSAPQPRTLGSAFDRERVDLEEAGRRVRELTARVRSDMRVVGEGDAIDLPDPGMSRVQFPSGLHTLIESLGQQERADDLIEQAHVLWAKATHDKFDVYLGPPVLAAALNLIVERLYWRVETPPDAIDARYGVEHDRVDAAVRLIVSRYEIRWVDPATTRPWLSAEEAEVLNRAQLALLYGVGIDAIKPTRMLM
jgi:tetratricopeptide (TPR) repeat protein